MTSILCNFWSLHHGNDAGKMSCCFAVPVGLHLRDIYLTLAVIITITYHDGNAVPNHGKLLLFKSHIIILWTFMVWGLSFSFTMHLALVLVQLNWFRLKSSILSPVSWRTEQNMKPCGPRFPPWLLLASAGHSLYNNQSLPAFHTAWQME